MRMAFPMLNKNGIPIPADAPNAIAPTGYHQNDYHQDAYNQNGYSQQSNNFSPKTTRRQLVRPSASHRKSQVPSLPRHLSHREDHYYSPTAQMIPAHAHAPVKREPFIV